MRPLKALPDEPATAPAEAEFEVVIRYHNGDADAAVRTLLEDCRYLRQQLALTQLGMSIGFTRGWTPRFDRD